MADVEGCRRIVALDHGLAVCVVRRGDGTMPATVVNAGIVRHPWTGDDVGAFILRPGSAKRRHLRADDHVTLVWRAGWAWFTLEGRAELVGPGDGECDGEELRLLRRDVFAAAGGEHEDMDEFDRVMDAEQRTVALVHVDRLYQNP